VVSVEEPVPLVLGGESGLLGGKLLRPLELPVALWSPEPPVAELGAVLLPVLVLPVPVVSPVPVGVVVELPLLLVPEPPVPRELSLFDLSFDLSLPVVEPVLEPELPVLPEVCADAASGILPAARQPTITIRLIHRVVMYLLSLSLAVLDTSITLPPAKETPGSPGGLVGHVVKDC
jgi:hypothetical protein